MSHITSILTRTVKQAVSHSLFDKMIELQHKLTELNVQKAAKSSEQQELLTQYDHYNFKLTVFDSEDGSKREFRSNRMTHIHKLNQLDNELYEIEISLAMIESMKEEVQYEIMMLQKLNEREVSM
ncbi:hypothetical protein ERX37_09260 [Macrococcus hajekii]|uniref:DUF5082 domain-containing protein n=1 Tax=Macrococcus hajekii TaxID=198482 RepID=A0A4R6BI50_9STAP|nr:hypothetical protein [Macrococcus hajekii]TDM01293.1 hypothetical protein ERX37_09260 [Macrococcus hajekii]GGB10386.1 hypothetical protein GCM10007190_18070 [Macrococcus hajekii]